jgi:hypothetical protein
MLKPVKDPAEFEPIAKIPVIAGLAVTLVPATKVNVSSGVAELQSEAPQDSVEPINARAAASEKYTDSPVITPAKGVMKAMLALAPPGAIPPLKSMLAPPPRSETLSALAPNDKNPTLPEIPPAIVVKAK